MASGSTIDEIMANVENCRPLPQGRDVAIAASASKGTISNDDLRKFESDLVRVSCNPNARAKVWIKYLDWFDQTHPSGSKEAQSLYKRAFNDVLSESVLENSSDVVIIAYRLALLERKPRNVFDDMYSKRKCVKVALFWIKWAHLVEQSGDMKQTRKIFEKALSLTLENKETVQVAYKNFQERLCCEAMQQCSIEALQQENTSEPSRVALSQLSSGSDTSVPIDRVSSATLSTGLARDHTQESITTTSRKLTIPSQPAVSSLKSRGCLGVTTEGKVKVETEKENDNPKSKWKNECLRRGSGVRGGQSSVVSSEQHQLVIPEVSDQISHEELYQEFQHIKTSLGRLEHAVLSQNNKLESSLTQQSNTIKECITTLLKSSLLKDAMRSVVSEIMNEHALAKEEVPATPAVAETENSETQINSGGSSFSYNNATTGWDSTYEPESANEAYPKINLSPSSAQNTSKKSEETVKKSSDNTEGQGSSEQGRKMSGHLVDMTPVVKTFNPTVYKQFTPATPANGSSGALNVSGITNLEAVDEQLSFGAGEEEFH